MVRYYKSNWAKFLAKLIKAIIEKFLYVIACFLPKAIKVKRGGTLLYINPKDLKSFRDSLGLTYGLNNLWWETCERVCKEGDIFVDVGANIGHISILASKKVGESGNIIAFEPEINCFELLKRNTKLHDCENISNYQLIISNQNEKVDLFYNKKHSHINSTINKNLEKSEVIKVDSVILDEFLIDYKKIDIIKLNIQGGEVDALRGSKNIIQNNLPIVLTEFWPLGITNSNEDPREIINFFKKLNYEVYELETSQKSQCVVKVSYERLNELINLSFILTHHLLFQHKKSKSYHSF